MSVMTNPIALRSGSAVDLDIVDLIMAEAFDRRFGEAWTRNQCLGILAFPGVWMTIATAGETAAGFALSRLVADEAELLLLATRPRCRRRGVAAALVRSIVADSQARAAQRLHLEVRDGNDAIRLYLDHGFTKVGERRNYYRGAAGQSYDAFTFARSLA